MGSPIRDDENGSGVRATRAPGRFMSTEETIRILVVDDDPIVLAVTEALISSMGYEVSTFDRGFGATREVYSQRPHIVLMDVMMPDLRGDQLVGPIQESEWTEGKPWPVVVFHSSMESDELKRLTEETGAAGFLRKTGSRDEFKLNLERLVRALDR